MRLAFGIDENVARLDVAVQDAVFVRVVDRARQFRDELRCISDRDRRALCHFIQLSAVDEFHAEVAGTLAFAEDRKSTRLNSSHQIISYAVFCLKKKKQKYKHSK